MTNISEDSLPTMYHEKDLYAGVTGRRRKQLTMLHRAFSGPFDAAQAAAVLDIDIHRTRRLLAAFAANGWLARVRHGWYICVPLEASEPSEWREESLGCGSGALFSRLYRRLGALSSIGG